MRKLRLLVVAAVVMLAAVFVSPATAGAATACSGNGFSGGWYTHPSGAWAAECAYETVSGQTHYVFNLHKYGSNGNCWDGIADSYCAGGIIDTWVTPGQAAIHWVNTSQFGLTHVAAGTTVGWTNAWYYDYGMARYRQWSYHTVNAARSETNNWTYNSGNPPSLVSVMSGYTTVRPRGLWNAANAYAPCQFDSWVNQGTQNGTIQAMGSTTKVFCMP